MAYRIVRSPAIERDIDIVFDHVFESYLTIGDSVPEAFERATQRIAALWSDMNSLALAPHQGTLHADLSSRLRHVTKNRAIFYFDVDDTAKTVRILAVFFGGQDHQRRMLQRLGSD
ncbi:KluB [Metarhizobium album]|uniref:KluB n=1 Tax=Metarhizobium album TaxID=2182425 RepID=A0A2U2DRC0_9HYPH|nr:type II toxin-antitoxin system RelE/ParE family toxin [Rhizobium album]PWE55863.1 KluB [Rhizobium album]